MRLTIVLVALAVLGCQTPPKEPKPLTQGEATALHRKAREAVLPAVEKCRHQPAPSACEAYYDLVLDSLFRADRVLEHWEKHETPGYFGCLMTETQTYLAQLDQKSPVLPLLDDGTRPCPR